MDTLVKDLLDAYEALALANSNLAAAIRNQEDMPCYLPTWGTGDIPTNGRITP